MEYANILLNGLTLLTVLYFTLVKSYFTEKGKNLATKEDIGEITKEVEAVKQFFNESLEQFKNDLNLSTQVRFTLKSAEIEALLDFYDKYFTWYNTLQAYSPPSLSEPYNDKIIQIIEKSYLDFLIAESKAELFIKNFKSFKIKHDLKTTTLELVRVISLFHIEAEVYNFRYNQLSEIKVLNERQSLHEQLGKDYKIAYEEFYKKKSECSKPIYEGSITFRMDLLKELKKLEVK